MAGGADRHVRRHATGAAESLTVALVAMVLAVSGCQSTPASDDGAGPGTGTASPTATASPTGERTATPTTRADRQEAAIDAILRRMTVRQKVGQLLVPYIWGADATDVTPQQAEENQRTADVDTPAELVHRYHVGGVILINAGGQDRPSGNLTSPTQMARLTKGLQAAATSDGQELPLLVGTDQEGGTVTRLPPPATQFPSAMALGAADDQELTRRTYAALGAELAGTGVNVDFAPVADVTAGPQNTVIGSRSFSASPTTVARHVVAAIDGLHDAGVTATVKHFPGHGDTAVDSHFGTPVVTKSLPELQREDLRPFQAAIDHGVDLVMVGHLVITALDDEPATFSRPVITGLLRQKLGYGGVVITDALNMAGATEHFSPDEAAVRAVLAGSDLLLMPPNVQAAQQALLEAVENGRLTEKRLDASVRRILRFKQRLHPTGAPPGSGATAADEAAAAAVTILSGPCDGNLLHDNSVQLVGGSDDDRDGLARALRHDGVSVGTDGMRVAVLSRYAGAASDPADVAVALDTPYALADSPADVRVAAYSDVPASLRAVADVLTGRARARGTAPVPTGLPGCG